jgi:hypothetical protein
MTWRFWRRNRIETSPERLFEQLVGLPKWSLSEVSRTYWHGGHTRA